MVPWQWIYDIRTAPTDYVGMAIPAVLGLPLIGGAIYTAWRPGEARAKAVGVAGLCVGALILAGIGWSNFNSIDSRKTLIGDVEAGRFQTVTGTISDARTIGRGGAVLVFSVGIHRFLFPYRGPSTCLPQDGEAAEIDFVPYNSPGLYKTTDTIVRMAMTRRCPSGEW